MKSKLKLTSLAAALLVAGTANAQSLQGPSTGSTPYGIGSNPNILVRSIATVDNVSLADDTFTRIGTSPIYGTGAYSMVGIPDGLGAFDNGDRTFTVLMTHEVGSTVGVTRDHGSKGAFVSQWTINKDTLAVVGAKDLIQNVNLWNGSGYTTFNAASPIVTGAASAAVYNAAIGRLCSADLAPTSAFSNGALGTTARLFLSGEEIGAEGRVFANIATGANAGTSYELPRLGKFSWENALASPFAQDKTLVMGLDDTTPGQLYAYVGTKLSTGNDVEKAGLTNGNLYGIKVGSIASELRVGDIGIGKNGSTAFSMVAMGTAGDVSGITGATLQSTSVTAGITEFLRPEDGAWDTLTNDKFYFVTTDRYDQVKDGVGSQTGRSRLWEMEFSDMANPENGGNIKLLLDGTEAVNMMDNIAVDLDGNILIVEDVGGQAHNGKLWRYNPTSGALELLAAHDPARNGDIGTAATTPFTNDEEFSGVIDITSLMADSALNTGNPNERWYLMDDQQHYALGGAQVEGGQLLAVQAVPEPSRALLALIGFSAMLFRRRRA
jgi:hypothetical protein